ncbi:transcriptional regulator [Basilea psittacipulmonis DSM 24701]|uniref:Transcriptional regulator n=2 Tax=Basilea TaxID=1472344 RepID=A0A077DFS1_9BURK|nr:transcriptional regulator [Basilea psittacipulmonis DSM 24701]
MYHEPEKGNVLAANCPSREILNHLTSKWGVLVMTCLYKKTKRFSEIRNEIEGINERMLSKTLQELEADGMVLRKSYDTVPPHVEYSLTAHGKQAAKHLRSLVNWLENHLEEILNDA